MDIQPPHTSTSVPILRCDAIRDKLPEADIAISTMTAHHLSAAELTELIRNVGRSCRRFLILDLVRHRAPFALFRLFVSPFVHRINVEDGIQSLRRAFTPAELRSTVAGALNGTGATFRHTVSLLSVRQIVDIEYSPSPAKPLEGTR